ncbi:hypothetical protein AKJ36_00690 [candidate division MSBL1 archaeon SCGC-AAA259I07]|uniref:Succinylglutamate desuccinylase/Aspartoacylase catalytic domain-containing protein n=1 Tax=candidate division MSBL1 archaeon SCGC-AAA259I07 TaxID=1698266 RepID=A0A133UMM7_9EURY|nr:hypothetical protein AKJ36_00690 [candidate division MSBL1 archaeon SCGC-AAA259I07]
MDSIPIDGFTVEPTEEKKTLRLEITRLFDDSPVSLPTGLISNGEDTKVCIISGQHGNEWNGIYSSQKFFKNVPHEAVKGTLIVIPIVNPLAFNEKSRVSSVDSIDLNRTYLNHSYRKPAEQIGTKLFAELFGEMDYIIDIHGGGPGEYSPHVAVTDENLIEKASDLLLPDVYLGSSSSGSLASACAKENIPLFTVEAGKRRHIDRAYTDKIIKGLENFLKGVDMLDGKPQEGKPVVHSNKDKVTSPASGFFTPQVDLGDRIEKGDKIGELEKLFGEEKIIRTSVSGKILYLRSEKVVSKGENLIHVTW